MSGLQNENSRLRQSLALLSEISQSFSSQTPVSAIFKIVTRTVNEFLDFDRTVVLTPTERRNWFRVSHGSGYSDLEDIRIEGLTVEVPGDLAKGVGPVLASANTPRRTPVLDRLARALGLSELVCVPILGDGSPVALLLSGRSTAGEPPLAEPDVETFTLVASLISSALLRGRISALEETDKLKTASFANISHEFRTPITLSLSPLEQILANQLDDLSPEVAESLRMVHRNQERLLGLINQILALAKLEMDGEALKVSPMPDVNRFIQERVKPFRAVAKAQGIHLWLALDPGVVGADLYLDPEQFDKLITNLLSNALKFTQKGHIKIGTELSKGSFALLVADTGIGISEDQLPYIFDRFRRAQHGDAIAAPGTGLGLALVKEVAARHGGEVTVTSQPGKGTSFRVRIPLGTGHLDSRAKLNLGTEQHPLPEADAVVHSENFADSSGVDEANRAAEAELDPLMPVVLYIDDNRDMRTHVASVLGEEFNVFLAYDGQDGLEKARRYRPDVIVSDQMMPRMGGGELIDALAHDDLLSPIPVLLLTAVSSIETRLESLNAGADDYLVKPFHRAELKARVRNLARAHEQERALGILNRRLEVKIEQQLGELVRTGELKKFLPKPVVERLLAGHLTSEQGYERTNVTILFVDAAGSRELAEQTEPEEFAGILNDYLSALTGAAVTHGGTVGNLMAHGLMVIFGAPEPCDAGDHAWCAAQAAFAMRSEAEKLRTRLARRGLPAELQLRIGMNSGYCTVGIFGSEYLNAYTAIGNPVTSARRLQAAAGLGAIMCGRTTMALLEGKVAARRAGPISAPGEPPMEANELLGLLLGEGAAAGSMPEPASPPNRRLFRKEGDFWTIAYEGSVFRLKDSKGLGYIAHLLGRPRREVHVVDLLLAVEGNPGAHPGASGAEIAGSGLRGDYLGGVGALLDASAKAAYKRRLEELAEDLEEARAFNDFGRAERAQAEIDVLVQALSAAVGLGGRDRKAASAAERARLNVTRAIKGSMEKIRQNNPALAQHLGLSINTGTFCSYTPDPGLPASWTL